MSPDDHRAVARSHAPREGAPLHAVRRSPSTAHAPGLHGHRHSAPGQHEHDFEPVPGLPEVLPEGERILWQGAPRWQTLARDVFHVRAIAIYFAVLAGWRGLAAASDTGSALQGLISAAFMVPLAAVALGILVFMARLMTRTTLYTLTNRRLVMRVGIVLTVTYNLPFSRIESAALRRNRDGTGDIALTLARGEQIAYAHLWPHARPWRFARTEPMLRGLRDAPAMAGLLAQAVADASPDGVQRGSLTLPGADAGTPTPSDAGLQPAVAGAR